MERRRVPVNGQVGWGGRQQRVRARDDTAAAEPVPRAVRARRARLVDALQHERVLVAQAVIHWGWAGRCGG